MVITATKMIMTTGSNETACPLITCFNNVTCICSLNSIPLTVAEPSTATE